MKRLRLGEVKLFIQDIQMAKTKNQISNPWSFFLRDLSSNPSNSGAWPPPLPYAVFLRPKSPCDCSSLLRWPWIPHNPPVAKSLVVQNCLIQVNFKQTTCLLFNTCRTEFVSFLLSESESVLHVPFCTTVDDTTPDQPQTLENRETVLIPPSSSFLKPSKPSSLTVPPTLGLADRSHPLSLLA